MANGIIEQLISFLINVFLTFCTCVIVSMTSEKASPSRFAKMIHKFMCGSSQEHKFCYLFSKEKIQKGDGRSGE